MADGDDFGIFAQRFDLPTATTTTTLDNTTTTTSGNTTTTTLGVTTTTTLRPDGDCGDPNGGGITATDALFVLQTAVALQSCALCVCDVDGGGSVSATDALLTLQLAVGTPNALNCPAC